jgi:hypothetical protein
VLDNPYSISLDRTICIRKANKDIGNLIEQSGMSFKVSLISLTDLEREIDTKSDGNGYECADCISISHEAVIVDNTTWDYEIVTLNFWMPVDDKLRRKITNFIKKARKETIDELIKEAIEIYESNDEEKFIKFMLKTKSKISKDQYQTLLKVKTPITGDTFEQELWEAQFRQMTSRGDYSWRDTFSFSITPIN